jgi:acetyltransferase-like isoleucine patch superfamily enzyme
VRNASFLTRAALENLGFASLGKDVLIHETSVLVGCDRISIGDKARIDPFCVVSAREPVSIGAYTHIAAHVGLLGAYGITIEDFVSVSHGARIFSASDDFKAGALIGSQVPDELRAVRSGRVVIERHGCVGANCVVLPGARLREGATVGALSLVRGELEPWTVNAGVPAKPVAKRDRDGVLRAEALLLNPKADG